MGFPREECWSGLPFPSPGDLPDSEIEPTLPAWEAPCPGGSAVKSLPVMSGDTRDMGLIPGSGRSPAEGTASHCSILAWRIPWTEEPGGLQSMGSQRVGHD